MMHQQQSITLTFYGGAETVTGSKYLLSTPGARILIDCGLFQGHKELRLRNWEAFPFAPKSIDAVLLTHAHIDHCGYLPRLVKTGFSGPVFCTAATADLVRIMLPDAAKLQEEDAAFANRQGFSKHHPALPLFSKADAARALKLLRPVPYDLPMEFRHSLRWTFRDAGHILGSSTIHVDVPSRDGDACRILFSGDLGRYGEPVMPDPQRVPPADYVVMESTYGDRVHEADDIKSQLAEVVNRTVGRGGRVLIPAFAVGRAQSVLFLLRELEEEGGIPVVPVYLDSPMAESATHIYEQHLRSLDEGVAEILRAGRRPFHTQKLTFVSSVTQSRQTVASRKPSIVISASGMATGGRVLHYLERMLPDERNSVLFVGYQAGGTRGRSLVDGAREVKMHGNMVPVHAHIDNIEGLSAHADQDEIIRWLGAPKHQPKRLFLVHGEMGASAALRQKIHERFGWTVEVPRYGQEVELT